MAEAYSLCSDASWGFWFQVNIQLDDGIAVWSSWCDDPRSLWRLPSVVLEPMCCCWQLLGVKCGCGSRCNLDLRQNSTKPCHEHFKLMVCSSVTIKSLYMLGCDTFASNVCVQVYGMLWLPKLLTHTVSEGNNCVNNWWRWSDYTT